MKHIEYIATYCPDGILSFRSLEIETIPGKRGTKGWYMSQGYVNRKVNWHPKSDKRGYVKEHRLVMEKELGRILNDDEYIHHIDGNRQNNDIQNLRLISAKEHAQEHLGKRNPNGRFIAADPKFDQEKYRLYDRDNGITQIYTLGELIRKTFRRGKFEHRGRFTGLKDKNGKDIYEFDIVRAYKPNSYLDGIYQVVWDDNRGRWAYAHEKKHGFDLDRKYQVGCAGNLTCEVIGNVYENPELISNRPGA